MRSILDNGMSLPEDTEKGSSSGLTAPFMKGDGQMTRRKDMGDVYLQAGMYTKDSSMITNSMGMGYYMQMGLFMKDNFITTRSMDRAKRSGLMELRTVGHI